MMKLVSTDAAKTATMLATRLPSLTVRPTMTTPNAVTNQTGTMCVHNLVMCPIVGRG